MTYDPRAAGALCDNCPLRHKKVVPPEGPMEAELVFVGEGPGQMEEQKRKPFIGPSGVMLNEILTAAGVDRKRVFVTNALLCRAETPNLKGKKRYALDTYMAWLRLENAKLKKAAARAGTEYTPIPSPLDCCHPRLMRELQWHEERARARGQPNGAVIIPVGNYALKTITGKAGIMKWRGSPLKVDINAPVINAKSWQRGT